MIPTLAGLAARLRPRRGPVAPVPRAALPEVLSGLAATGAPVCVVTGPDVDAAGLLAELPAGSDLCVPLRHVAAAGTLARDAARRSVTLTLRVATWNGTAAAVLAEVRRRVPTTGVQLDARLPGAEQACAALDGRVQLVTGSLPAPAGATAPADAELAAVRCLEVLLAGPAQVAVDAGDPQLARLAVERAAWHARPHVPPSPRPPESWELLMPYDRPNPPLPAPVRLLVPVTGGAA
ncbi:hypothetical protein [Modestobacter sp. NPDC049651]|uniref:hypothetical protein n=1 Tax=unclassified Modestobacter TaxID=2643866 RepID=UPI0033D6A56A